jgi:tetratricopeptide (TPR) repeat protein
MRRAGLLVAIAAALSVHSPRAPAAEVAALVAEAGAALSAGRIERAIDLLAPRVDEDPGAIVPLLLEAYRGAQRFADGRALLERLAPGADAAAPLVIAAAQWEAEEGWGKRAEARLDAAIALRPADGELWAARARLASSLGDPAAALAAAERAIAAGVDPRELASLRAEASIELGRSDDAAPLLAALVAADPGHPAARLARARLARARGDRSAAIEELWEILERSPDHAVALAELGGLLVRDPASAAAGERALARFRELRDRRERIERLTKERREGRDSPATRAELARHLREDGRAAAALAVASHVDPADAAAGTTDHPELLAEAGRALAELGDPRAACERLGRAILADPSRAALRLELAEALLACGDAGGAGIALERCRGAVDPRRWQLAEVERGARLGLPWARVGAYLLRLLTEHPDDPEIARTLVDAAIALRGVAEARTALETLRGEHPEALAPLTALLWLALEAPERAAPPVLDALAAELGKRASAPGVLAPPDVWLALASAEEARGSHVAAEASRRAARRARALAGDPE